MRATALTFLTALLFVFTAYARPGYLSSNGYWIDLPPAQYMQNTPPQWHASNHANNQLVIVTTDSWSSTTGTLQRYERASTQERFAPVGDAFKVNVGRSGLAWGRGLHLFMNDQMRKNLKAEGDGKAPAGVFELGYSFGHTENSSPNEFAPTVNTVDRRHICVDDPNSPSYNKIIPIDDRDITADGIINKRLFINSYEFLLRTKIDEEKGFNDQYEIAVTVNHNNLLGQYSAQVRGGSCIFLHVEGHVNKPTSGCTSMEREKLVEVVNWLDDSKHPVLIQVPKSELSQFFRK